MAAFVVALALVVGQPSAPADAANPTLSVTPGSLVLDSGTSGVVHVTWSSGGPVVANVRYHTESDPQWQITALTGAAGTGKPLTVACCHTYTFALFATAGGQMLGVPPVTVVTKPKVLLDPGCLIQCITQSQLGPHGTYADFFIKTNEPAMISIQASTQPPNPDGTLTGKPIAASVFGILPGTQLSGVLSDLSPSTQYHYVIQAHDQDGHTSTQAGTFTTKKRYVKVTFTKIWVTDDGDGGLAGDGELAFYAWLNDVGINAIAQPANTWPLLHAGSIGTGEQVVLGTTVEMPNPSSQLKVRVFGHEDDGSGDCFVHLKCDDWNEVTKIVTAGGSTCGDMSIRRPRCGASDSISAPLSVRAMRRLQERVSFPQRQLQPRVRSC
ncbi:MAG: fibronectin type III domain-containing protein [Chloroflexi bacterium]|nr:fibronectin type III domain-containing protein [Chloroflexota bacterium]